VIERFILSQRDGATDMYMAVHDHFVDIGRHQIETVDEATALKEASDENYERAPEIQYQQALDAWVRTSPSRSLA